MKDLNDVRIDPTKYPILSRFSKILYGSERPPIGREMEMKQIQYGLNNPEMKNVVLLGPAGVGKSALVEGYAMETKNKGVIVFEVDLTRMAGDNENKFGERIKGFADEFLLFSEEWEQITKDWAVPLTQFVMFMDEMHILTRGGDGGAGGGSGAGNAIKPLLARGAISMIGATTDEEYNNYIVNDHALTRRLMTVNVLEPSYEVQVLILENMAEKYIGSDWQTWVKPEILKEIIYYTDQYDPSNTQPAKSIKILDRAIGVHRVDQTRITHDLIARIMDSTMGVDIDQQTDVMSVIQHIRANLFGQDNAITLIEDRLYVANAGLQDPGKPLANFLFAGATGVGKTELAKLLAKGMLGDEKYMIRYDMSEYSLKSDVEIFQDRISGAIRKMPRAVVLLDEFEKADRAVMNLLLGILDDGRLSDRYGRQVTFKNCIMILTTNAGQNVFKEIRSRNMSARDAEGLLRRALGNVFSPEFLGRFDELIPFEPLTQQGFSDISKLQMTKLVKRVNSLYDVPVRFKQDVITYLVKEDFEALKNPSAGGGRAMNRRIYREVAPLIGRVLDAIKINGYSLSSIEIEVLGEMREYAKDVRQGSSYLSATFRCVDPSSRTVYDGKLSKLKPMPGYEPVGVLPAEGQS